MKKGVLAALVASLGLLACGATASAYEAFKGPLGLLAKAPGSVDGYTLVAPQMANTTYLIDLDGNVVHEWKSEYGCFYAELLPNGNLLRHSSLPDVGPAFGGQAGLIEEFDWDGNKVWEYKCYTPGKEVSHHTFEVMPNGNVLLLVWQNHSYEEALAKGLDPNMPGRNLFQDGLKIGKEMVAGIWPDVIREVEHGTGKVVWEWDSWDHVGTGPDQIDINKYIPPTISRAWAGPDWTHFNGVTYNPATNEVAFTSRNLAEVFIIDYKTDKGIKYRWGNPANYGAGKAPGGYADDGDQKLFGPHAPDWTAEGTLSILDNGHSRPTGNYTRAVELDPRTSKVVWEWKAADVGTRPWNFYSATQCGCQKLANGNWLITTTLGGHVIEVKPNKDVVWEFINPMGAKDKVYATSGIYGDVRQLRVHKALRYAKDDPRFAGKDMSVKRPLMPKGTPDWVELLKTNPVPAAFQPKN